MTSDADRDDRQPDADSGPPEGAQQSPGSDPAPGGYAGRDPKTEMPVVPSAPETQGDGAMEHDGQPDDKERDPFS